MKDIIRDFKERWKIFFLIVFDPWVLSFLFLSLIMMAFSYAIPIEKPDNAFLKAILSVLLSLASIGLGAVIHKRWSDFTESRAVEIRGSAAIRDLKLLLNAITSLRERVRCFLNNKEAEHTKDSKHYLAEIIDKCTSLQENVVVSIEHWTDILPEAEVKTVIGTITKLQSELAQKELERVEAIEEMEAMKEKTVEEATLTALGEKRKEIAEKIANLKAELTEKKAKFDINVPSTGVGYSGLEEMYITRDFVLSRLVLSLEEIKYNLSFFKPGSLVNLLQQHPGRPELTTNPYYAYVKQYLDPFLEDPVLFAFMSKLHLEYLKKLLIPPGPTTVEETLVLVHNLRSIEHKD